MPVIYRKYGEIVEITETEKEPSKIRVYSPRARRIIYGPRRRDNIWRTKQICVRRLSSALEEFGCPLLVTLTFKGDASDASFANDSLRRFQVRLQTKFPKAQSLFVPELSPRGRIHFHGLVFNVPLSLGDTKIGRRIISYGDERKTRILAKLWGQGFVDARKTDGSRKLAYYISKYITKGAGEVLFNAMRLLRISHGFPKEIVIRGKLAEELKRRYDKKESFKNWSGENYFTGKITKKFYLKEKL
ncbi:MAG: hypothetical protein HYY86_02735 [Candidatus Harrisonbacteria bacterium]|nr:hypothetical protein [Candidatus Harrisonbacteria bacterium]